MGLIRVITGEQLEAQRAAQEKIWAGQRRIYEKMHIYRESPLLLGLAPEDVIQTPIWRAADMVAYLNCADAYED